MCFKTPVVYCALLLVLFNIPSVTISPLSGSNLYNIGIKHGKYRFTVSCSRFRNKPKNLKGRKSFINCNLFSSHLSSVCPAVTCPPQMVCLGSVCQCLSGTFWQDDECVRGKTNKQKTKTHFICQRIVIDF